MIVLGLLTIETPWETPWPDFVFISVLFGLVLAIDGAVRVAGHRRARRVHALAAAARRGRAPRGSP